MSNSDLCYGFLFGFLTAGVLGTIFQRIYLLSRQASMASRKVALVETKLSPKQVYRNSVKAQTEIILWIVVLIVIVIAAVWIYLGS